MTPPASVFLWGSVTSFHFLAFVFDCGIVGSAVETGQERLAKPDRIEVGAARAVRAGQLLLLRVYGSRILLIWNHAGPRDDYLARLAMNP